VARICHPLELIFVHIPKCAGSSIGFRMDYVSKRYNVFEKEINTRILRTTNKHATADDCKYFLSSEVYDKYHKFSVVRNPFARAVSWYMFRLQRLMQGRIRTNGVAADAAVELELNIMLSQGFQSWVRNYAFQPWNGTWFSLATPQSFWLNDDFEVIKYEDIDQGIRHLKGFERGLKNRLKKTKEVNYRSFYDRKTRQYIGKMFEEDIERFEYKF